MTIFSEEPYLDPGFEGGNKMVFKKCLEVMLAKLQLKNVWGPLDI